jgi:hypothetical protein
MAKTICQEKRAQNYQYLALCREVEAKAKTIVIRERTQNYQYLALCL